MVNSKSLFSIQLIAHLAFLFLLFYGSPVQWLVVFIVYFFSGCIGMTATYHRLLSHRSWKCPLWVEYFGVFCATIGLTGSAIGWVAVHRKHHRFADTPKDPHSPKYKGFVYCQWLSMFESIELRYVADLLKKPFYIFQHKHYFTINLAYSLILYWLDPMAVIYAWLVPACLLWNAGSSIITFSHIFGKNEHRIQSRAGNIALLGILVWGEGWHNNHHYNEKDKCFASYWWQIDVGYYYIATIEWFFQGHARAMVKMSKR